MPPNSKAAVSGRGEEEPKSAWVGGDTGGGARSQRWHEGGARVGKAATEGTLAGRELNPGKVGLRPRLSCPPRGICRPKASASPGRAALGLLDLSS